MLKLYFSLNFVHERHESFRVAGALLLKMQTSFFIPNSSGESDAELKWFTGVYEDDTWCQNGPISTMDVQKLHPRTAVWNGVTVKEWTLLENVHFGLDPIPVDALLPICPEPSAPAPPSYAEATAPSPPSYDEAVGRTSIESDFSRIHSIQNLASNDRNAAAADELEWYCGVYGTDGEWVQAGPLLTCEIENLDPKTAVWNGVTVLEWTLLRDVNISSNQAAPAPPAYDQAVGIAAVESNMSSSNMENLRMQVTLSDERESIMGEFEWYCGVYDDAGVWTQAGPLTTSEVKSLDPMTAVWNGNTVKEWNLLKNIDI